MNLSISTGVNDKVPDNKVLIKIFKIRKGLSYSLLVYCLTVDNKKQSDSVERSSALAL